MENITIHKTRNTKMKDMVDTIGGTSLMIGIFVAMIASFKSICLYLMSGIMVWRPDLTHTITDFTSLADLIVKTGGAVYICLKISRFFKSKNNKQIVNNDNKTNNN